MADTTNLVTPKAAEGQAQTYEGDAAAMPQVRGAKSLTIESLPSSKTTEQLNEEQLEKFLDVNLDTQERRDFKRKVSKWKLMISMVLTVFLETLICLGFYAFFIYCKPRSGGGHSVHGSDRDEGAGNKSAGWPSLAGVSTVLTIIGAALTFLLVFSLGWTSRPASFTTARHGTLLTYRSRRFNRWRSARALMDETVTTLRELYIYVGTQEDKKGLTNAQKEELKGFRMTLLWYGAMLVIYMDTAKVTDWQRSDDGPMDYVGELVANWWLRSSFYDWFMRKLYIKDPDYNSQADLRKKEPKPDDNENHDMKLDVFKESVASKSDGRRVVIPDENGGGFGKIEHIIGSQCFVRCDVARDDTGESLVVVDVKELVLDLEDERVVIPTERGGGYGTIKRVTDGMCVIVRDDEGGVDMDGKGLPSRLEVHVDELVHAPREKILPYYKAEVLKAQVSIRQQLVKFKKDKKFDIEPMVIPLNMYSSLVNNFYAMNKFKIYQMPHLIKRYLLPALTYAYTFIIFPVLLPYTFVMNLDPRAVRNELLLTNKWSTAVFLGIFVVSTSLILFYFNLLYAIQKELEDPFGDDFSDLKLRKRFLTPLIKDFKTYSDALEPKGSTSERAEKVRALLVYDNETPEAPLVNVGKPAEDDGEADQK